MTFAIGTPYGTGQVPHDAAKLARIRLNLHELQSADRGVMDLYADARESYRQDRDALLQGMRSGNRVPWDDSQEVAVLLSLPADVLEDGWVDVHVARRCAQARERMFALQRRHDELQAEIAPLSQLVNALVAYVAGRS